METFVIYSQSEGGYWSNKDGWVGSTKEADYWKGYGKDVGEMYNLPLSKLGDAEFVPYDESVQYIEDVMVRDPDTGGFVEVEIWKLPSGAMIGVDASYLDQVTEVIVDPTTGNKVILPDHISDAANFGAVI